MNSLLVLFCLIGVTLQGTLGQCPFGWINRPGADFCYSVESVQRSWLDANLICKEQDANLVSIESTDELVWVRNQISNDTKRGIWWTGLNDIAQSGQRPFVWSDGSAAGENFITWLNGEPNNQNGNEFCAVIGRAGLFSDRTCQSQNAFICKRKKDQPFYCDHVNGWESFNGKCYKSFTNSETYYDAQTICRNENGFLTTVQNVTDAQRILFLAKRIGHGVWIGLQSTPANNALGFEFLQWDNGEDVGQTFWYNSRYPYKVAGQENNTCAFTIYWGSNPAKSWQTTICDGTSMKAVMCEKAQGMCSPGWVGFMDQCYQINAKTPMTFEDANSDCTSVGAHLLTIKSEAEQVFVNDTILYNLRTTGFSRMWFGITQQQPSSAFMWTTGEDLSTGYTNWDTNQPFMDDKNIQGGVLYTGAIEGRWSVTSDVYIPTPYVCQINSAQTPMFITTPAPQYRCEYNAGWRRWKSNCYYMNTTAIPWLNARQSCRDSGADLVDIRSRQENSFLIGKIQSDCWIGLNDFALEGQFVWLDENTAPPFTKWNDGEPNNAGSEHCTEITGTPNLPYTGLWNDNDCTLNKAFVCKKPAQIVGVTDAPTTQSAQWTAKCGYGWEDDTMSDYCYRFVSQATTWSLARQTCQVAGGDLLSITSLHEQYYITGRVNSMNDLILWMGFNDIGRENRWVWSDQSGAAYFNWNGGEPNDQSTGQDCGVVLTTHGRWDDEYCDRRFGYICKKTGDIPTTIPAPTPTLPAGTVMGCPSGWKGWRDSCYKFVKADSLSGSQGLTACRTYGGDLASIGDRAEDNYIRIQTKNLGGDQWLIGLNDIEKEGIFKWTDGSPVAYTNWNPGEPNDASPGDGEDCVELNPNIGGYWNDVPCGSTNEIWGVDGYVCKSKQGPVAPTTGAPTFPGCSTFYDLGYGQSCYKFVEAKKTFANAEADCLSNSGHLVAVSDASEQAYLSSQLALRSEDYWIGLSNQGDNSGVYSWTSGAQDTFSNWNSLHSGNERNKCVTVGTGVSLGLWSDNDCTPAKKYICENDMKPTTSPGQLTCPDKWVLDADWNMCYRAFIKSNIKYRKTWEDARAHCQTFGGDLISIHSNDTNAIIDGLTPGWVTSRGFWIGLNSRDPNTAGHTWSDGSAFNFANWMPYQPDNHNGAENCVALQSDPLTWNDANCYGAREWICQMPTNTPLPTGAGRPGPTGDTSVSCGQGWIHYNGMCYLFPTQRMTWYKSKDYCQGFGGNLVSVQDQDENDFLLSQISTSHGDRWIGLNELGNIGYRWTDYSPATYFFWAPNEPNDAFGAEKCVTMSHWHGLWNDDNCNQDHQFICEKLNGSYSTVQPVTRPPAPGNCKNGYFAVGDKCYRYFDEYVNFTTAFEKCTSFGSGYYLASINNYYDLVNILLKITARESFYIGLHNQGVGRKFVWMDNTEVAIANWANGEPNGLSSSNTEACVECYNSGDFLTGKWNDINCDSARHFLCEGPKDPLAPPPLTPINPCKSGYQPYGGNCYKLDLGLRIWDQANRFCQADGAVPVSITNHYELYFVFKLLLEGMGTRTGNVWLGLTDKTIPGLYIWSDNWPVTVTNWGPNEPSRGKDEGCVAMDRYTAVWTDTKCAETLPVVCKISTETPPTLPPFQIGQCDDGWIPHESKCYKLSDDKGTWSEGNFQCQREGATLVSIHSNALNDYLVSAATGANLQVDSFWIGLLRRSHGGFLWADNTGVGFTKWNDGEPNDQGEAEQCVGFFKVSGLWNDNSCDVPRGYMCMRQGKLGVPASTPKVIPGGSTPGRPSEGPAPPAKTTPPPDLPSKAPQNQSSEGTASEIGLIVGVCCGVILLLAAVSAGVIYWKRMNYAKNASGFDNAVYMKSEDIVNIQGNVAQIDATNHQQDDGFNSPGISIYEKDASAC
ncbi:macrophage mannose receptor 1-like isoform X2 [Lineus longissimus]|uniref:macrophage mannose receptor 1-like isoform X2 n=1 Tax=Lineus longissimus TaxID=88925 RepID=UPI002B4F387B